MSNGNLLCAHGIQREHAGAAGGLSRRGSKKGMEMRAEAAILV